MYAILCKMLQPKLSFFYAGEDIGGRHWTIFGCSAVTGDGLITGFDWLVDDISSRIFMMS